MKRSAETSAKAQYVDFSTLLTDSFSPPDICLEAAAIACNLIQNDLFFEGTFGEVLREIAGEHGLPTPTREVIHNIRQNLRCTISTTHDPEVYMQCSTEKAEIFINEQVDLAKMILGYALSETSFLCSGSTNCMLMDRVWTRRRSIGRNSYLL
jgi:hypothetical protein